MAPCQNVPFAVSVNVINMHIVPGNHHPQQLNPREMPTAGGFVQPLTTLILEAGGFHWHWKQLV